MVDGIRTRHIWVNCFRMKKNVGRLEGVMDTKSVTILIKSCGDGDVTERRRRKAAATVSRLS